MLTLKVVFSVPDAEVMSSNGPSSLSIHEQEQISAGIAVKSMWNQRNKGEQYGELIENIAFLVLP